MPRPPPCGLVAAGVWPNHMQQVDRWKFLAAYPRRLVFPREPATCSTQPVSSSHSVPSDQHDGRGVANVSGRVYPIRADVLRRKARREQLKRGRKAALDAATERGTILLQNLSMEGTGPKARGGVAVWTWGFDWRRLMAVLLSRRG